MIIYDLRCEENHKFEGWFQDNLSFEEQKRKKLITCPVCGSSDIDMIPSSVAIMGRGGSPESVNQEETDLSPQMTLKMLHQYIDQNFDNVGNNFAEVALKMHRGEEPKRNIKGYTTKNEEKELKEEGIEFIKVPIPKFDS